MSGRGKWYKGSTADWEEWTVVAFLDTLSEAEEAMGIFRISYRSQIIDIIKWKAVEVQDLQHW